jgi:transcription antitermination factor NusG
MDWHVLYVKARCEKKAAAHCARHHLDAYLPLRRETRIYQRRRVTVDKPVFQGYVFARFSPAQRADLMRSHAVLSVIDVEDQARFLRELDQVRLALNVDPTLGVERVLKPGRRVRITSGPFMGLEGTVRTVRGTTRVMLAVEMIGQAVVVDAETALLEPLD